MSGWGKTFQAGLITKWFVCCCAILLNNVEKKTKTMLRESNPVRFQTGQTSGSVVVEKIFEEVPFVSLLRNSTKQNEDQKPIAYKQSCTFSNRASILIRSHWKGFWKGTSVFFRFFVKITKQNCQEIIPCENQIRG